MEGPEVDSIEAEPGISIGAEDHQPQPARPSAPSPKFTDYLRLLYSSIGIHTVRLVAAKFAPEHGADPQHVLALKPEDRIMVLAPVVRGRKASSRRIWKRLAARDLCVRAIDGVLRSLDEDIPLDRPRITPSKWSSIGCWCVRVLRSAWKRPSETATKWPRAGAHRGREWR